MLYQLVYKEYNECRFSLRRGILLNHDLFYVWVGSVNARLGSTATTPFYLWEPPANTKLISASRSISRSKMRWSQVGNCVLWEVVCKVVKGQ